MRPARGDPNVSPESAHSDGLSGSTLAQPLSEISANVARVPHAALTQRKEADESNFTSEDLMYWKAKAMLSPVAEESPSPKGPTRRLQPLDPELRAKFSPHGQLIRISPPREDKRPGLAKQSKQPHTSPTKAPVRPLSPGSQKMQNFLQRLERQGLSHD